MQRLYMILVAVNWVFLGIVVRIGPDKEILFA